MTPEAYRPRTPRTDERSKETEHFIDVMSGPWARLGRVVLGLALIAAGLLVLGTVGIVLIAVGLVPLGLGLSGRCVLRLFVRAQPGRPSGLRP